MLIRLATEADKAVMADVCGAANEAAKCSMPWRLAERFGASAARTVDRPFAFPWDALVAEVDGRVVGFSGWRYDPATRFGEVKGNYVHPDFWGRGISSRLVVEGQHRLEALGARVVKVRTEEANAVARHIYEKRGFEWLATAPHYARLASHGEDTTGPPGVTVRPAEPRDAEKMLDIECANAERLEAFEPLLIENRHGPVGGVPWRERLRAPEDVSFALAIERDRALLGYIFWAPPGPDGTSGFRPPVVAACGEEERLALCLVQAACRRMSEAGAAIVQGETLDRDRPAIVALEQAGFARIGAIVIYTRGVDLSRSERS